MKVEDLRIGNWFNVKPISHIDLPIKPIQIKDIHQRPCDNEYSINGFIWGSGDWMAHTVEDLQPIPLTEEILLKCGFKGRTDFKWIDNIGVQIINEKYYVAFKDMGNVVFHSLLQIKYLDELQNIYYTLTKTELKIEL